MKRIQTIEINSYEYQDGFYFDIVRKYKENICEIWLYHKNSDIKRHIVSASVEGNPPTEDQMLQMAEDIFKTEMKLLNIRKNIIFQKENPTRKGCFDYCCRNDL